MVISGGSGLIGQALSHALAALGCKVIILSRNKIKPESTGNIEYAYWNPLTKDIEWEPLQEAECLIHLAGTSVASGRWTPKRKQLIRDSRTNTTAFLVETLKTHPHSIKTVIAASAIGYYGNAESHTFVETDPPADDFLGETCVQWETELKKFETLNIRTVIFRLGIVLSRSGGALPKMEMPLKFGIAGIPGSGQQWTSWIHIKDLCQLIIKSMLDIRWQGIYNGVSPFPTSQKLLVQTLAKRVKPKFVVNLRIPSFVLKVLFGEMSMEILKNCRVSAEKTLHEGFVFSYPTIGRALEDLYE